MSIVFEPVFDNETTEEEKEFFRQSFPNLSAINIERERCTSCNNMVHANKIRTHKLLRVSQCIDCVKFYDSGEFDKDSDGEDQYCRWCGQGGDLFICDRCQFGFCNKCIRNNLGIDTVTRIEKAVEWQCFACIPYPIWKLQASHWALKNAIAMHRHAANVANPEGAQRTSAQNLLNPLDPRNPRNRLMLSSSSDEEKLPTSNRSRQHSTKSNRTATRHYVRDSSKSADDFEMPQSRSRPQPKKTTGKATKSSKRQPSNKKRPTSTARCSSESTDDFEMPNTVRSTIQGEFNCVFRLCEGYVKIINLNINAD